MLTLAVNRYFVVFKVRLNCKTLYGTASHSEDAMLLLGHHIKVILSVFSSFNGGQMSVMVKGLNVHQRGRECEKTAENNMRLG